MKKAQGLANNYAEAYMAYSKKNYDKAIGLFKSIVMEDADYKDASRLLAESVEYRRTARKWWQSKWVWGGVGIAALLGVAWFVFRYGLPLLAALPTPTLPTGTSAAGGRLTPIPATATFTPSPTLTPTPLPYSWARLNSGQFLPRDTITAIVIDPNDSGVMYIGTQNAGIYKSIDGGISWQPIHNGLGRASIYTLIMDPNDSKILYAGTLLGGVYKTTDGGLTWQAMNAGIERRHEWVAIVVMDQQDSQHLYFIDAGGLFETTDGGQSWTITDFKSQFIAWNSLWIEPSEFQALYVSTESGLLVSNDKGGTWAQSTSNSCSALVFDPQDTLTAYCTSFNEVLKTSNGGQQWVRLANLVTGWPSALAVSPQEPNLLILGTTGLLVSEDGGKAWQERGSGLGGNGVELKISSAASSVLYAQGLDQTIYFSEDDGRNWSNLGMGGRSLSFDRDRNNIYILNDDNLTLSQDNGKSWEQNALPLLETSPHAIAAHPTNPNRVYALYGRNTPPYIYYSDDMGITWQETSGMQDVSNPRLFFDHSTGQRVYAIGDLQASFSDDEGITWENCGEFPSGAWTSVSDARAAMDPRNGNRLLLATRGNGVVISDDGCETWQFSNNGLGSLFVSTVAIDLNNPDTIYAGTDGGAYISFDGGQTWGQVNDGLLGATVVYSIVVDKDSNVYAATPYGIFKLETR